MGYSRLLFWEMKLIIETFAGLHLDIVYTFYVFSVQLNY